MQSAQRVCAAEVAADSGIAELGERWSRLDGLSSLFPARP